MEFVILGGLSDSDECDRVLRLSEICIHTSDALDVALCPKNVYKYRTVADLKQLVADPSAQLHKLRSGRPSISSTSEAATPWIRRCSGLVHAGQLRRIDRGLYDLPRLNRLTKRPAVADYPQSWTRSHAAIRSACWLTA